MNQERAAIFRNRNRAYTSVAKSGCLGEWDYVRVKRTRSWFLHKPFTYTVWLFFFFKLNWAEWKTSPKSVLLSSSWELEMQRLEPSLEPTEWSVFHAMSWWLACPAIWGALVYQSWHGGLSGTQVSLAVMKVKKWGEGTHWTGEPTEGSCELSPPLYLPNLPQYSWLNRSLQILG